MIHGMVRFTGFTGLGHCVEGWIMVSMVSFSTEKMATGDPKIMRMTFQGNY